MFQYGRFLRIASICSLVLSATLFAADWQPHVEAASDEGEEAIARFRAPQGFQVNLFAAEPRLANPVAFHIDEKGRFFVVETYRFKGGVLDLREVMDWLDDDTASRTVAMRREMVTKHRGPEGVKQLEVASDRLKLIEDRDGDGKADFDSVFTDGDNKLEDGVASGVLARYGDIYYANIPSLYLLRDTDGDGTADVKQSLHYGYGTRYAYLGHDLHGLRFGPDGKLYFSMGDRGTHIEKSVDGKLVANPDSGAVFRCNPDGSELEIVHTGLRNPQELAFDQYGNLFTGDNNSDGGDQARWVQVVEGGDSGWRIGYQHQEFPMSRGPWNSEQIWQPNPPTPVFYRLPPIAILPAAGPAGLAYTPGTGMPEQWENRFLLCDFRGGTGSGIFAIKNTAKGATFEMEAQEFIWECLPTDVEFGYDGGVYFSDWHNGWDLPGKGRLYHVVDPAAANDPVVKETAKLMAEGFAKREPDELAKLLAHPDMRVRQEAQFELAGRSADSVAVFNRIATDGPTQLARLHAIWGLGQIARNNKRNGDGFPLLLSSKLTPLQKLLSDKDDEVRAQAAKVFGDARSALPAGLVKLLADPSSRVRFFAAMSLGKIGDAECVPHVATMLRENNDQDAYLRHAGVMALAGIGSKNLEPVLAIAQDESPAVRMGVLLALRRLGSAEIARFLADADPNVVLEAARAINDHPIDAAMPALAAMLDNSLPQQPGGDEVVLMRAINATYRLGTKKSAERLARFAAKEGGNEFYRADALRLLGEWEKPPGREHIVGVWRPLPDRDPKIAKAAVTPALVTILKSGPDALRAAAADLVGRLEIDDPAVLTQLVGAQNLAPEVRAAAVGALADANDPRAAEAIRAGLTDGDLPVRLRAISLAMKLPDGIEHLKQILKTGGIHEQQAALAALGNAPAAAEAGEAGAGPEELLSAGLDALLAGQLPPELHLDLLEAAAARKNPELTAKLKQFEESRRKDDPLAQYRESLAGGDVEAGRKIFLERADVSCLKCHAINQQGGNAGPDLAGIGTRQTREYLLESLLYPNQHIAEGFETVIVRLKGGDVVAGVLKSETADEIVLDIPEKGLQTIKTADIDKRKGGQSAMPADLVKTLSKRDVRNLIEFMASLR